MDIGKLPTVPRLPPLRLKWRMNITKGGMDGVHSGLIAASRMQHAPWHSSGPSRSDDLPGLVIVLQQDEEGRPIGHGGISIVVARRLGAVTTRGRRSELSGALLEPFWSPFGGWSPQDQQVPST